MAKSTKEQTMHKYGEPWSVSHDDDRGSATIDIGMPDDQPRQVILDSEEMDCNDAEVEFIDRIAECVNALAGIADPAQFVADVREALMFMRRREPSPDSDAALSASKALAHLKQPAPRGKGEA